MNQVTSHNAVCNTMRDAIRCKLHALCLCTLGHMQTHSLTNTRAPHTHTHPHTLTRHSQILERTTWARIARTMTAERSVHEMRRRSAILKLLDLRELNFAQFDFPLDYLWLMVASPQLFNLTRLLICTDHTD